MNKPGDPQALRSEAALLRNLAQDYRRGMPEMADDCARRAAELIAEAERLEAEAATAPVTDEARS